MAVIQANTTLIPDKKCVIHSKTILRIATVPTMNDTLSFRAIATICNGNRVISVQYLTLYILVYTIRHAVL